MIKKFIGTIAFAMAMLAITPAGQAQEFKPYIGGGLGLFVLDFTGSGVTGVSNKDVFGGFGIFGVDYGDFVGGELRVGSAANTSFDNGSVNETLSIDYFFSYLAKLQFPVSEDFRFYTLIGGTSSKSSLKINTPGFVFVATNTTSVSDTSTSFTVGAGLDFKIRDQLLIGAEWLRYGSDVDGFTGTVKFLF